jgi:cysteine synthase B
MGTTGTIMGTSAYLKAQNPAIQIIGVRPATEQDLIPGIRRWSPDYLPKIFEPQRVDLEMDVTQVEAETMMRRLAAEEGIFCGVSSGGAMAAALRLAQVVENATIVTIICDRGDRYISTGVFPA